MSYSVQEYIGMQMNKGCSSNVKFNLPKSFFTLVCKMNLLPITTYFHKTLNSKTINIYLVYISIYMHTYSCFRCSRDINWGVRTVPLCTYSVSSQILVYSLENALNSTKWNSNPCAASLFSKPHNTLSISIQDCQDFSSKRS